MSKQKQPQPKYDKEGRPIKKSLLSSQSTSSQEHINKEIQQNNQVVPFILSIFAFIIPIIGFFISLFIVIRYNESKLHRELYPLEKVARLLSFVHLGILAIFAFLSLFGFNWNIIFL